MTEDRSTRAIALSAEIAREIVSEETGKRHASGYRTQGARAYARLAAAAAILANPKWARERVVDECREEIAVHPDRLRRFVEVYGNAISRIGPAHVVRKCRIGAWGQAQLRSEPPEIDLISGGRCLEFAPSARSADLVSRMDPLRLSAADVRRTETTFIKALRRLGVQPETVRLAMADGTQAHSGRPLPGRSAIDGPDARILVSAPPVTIATLDGMTAVARETHGHPLATFDIAHLPGRALRSAIETMARRTAEQFENEKEANGLAGRIIDEMLPGAEATGEGVAWMTVTQRQRRVTASFGIRTYGEDEVREEIKTVTGTFDLPQEDPPMRGIATQLNRIGRRHARLLSVTGRPPLPTTAPEDVDLSRYRVDPVLAGLLRDRTPGHAKAILRTFIATQTMPDGFRPGDEGPLQGVHVSLARNVIGAETELSADVDWRCGRLRVRGLDLPETVRTAIIGSPVRGVVEHRWFGDDIVITAVTTRRRGDGEIVTYLHTQGGASPADLAADLAAG